MSGAANVTPGVAGCAHFVVVNTRETDVCSA
jgi:hypothetical protein